ncbi:MAG: hypothetical protein WDO73_15925 [Ignavibacteriota bacterium]
MPPLALAAILGRAVAFALHNHFAAAVGPHPDRAVEQLATDYARPRGIAGRHNDPVAGVLRDAHRAED